MREERVELEWGYQVRLYAEGELITCRLTRFDGASWVFLWPHVELREQEELCIGYGPWTLREFGSILRLEHCGERVAFKVYARFWQALLRLQCRGNISSLPHGTS